MKRNTLILLLVGLAFGAYLYFVEAEREAHAPGLAGVRRVPVEVVVYDLVLVGAV